jgi:hypothetical protein
VESLSKLAAALAAVLLIVGCAAPIESAAEPFGAAPEDFSIEVEIATGPNAPDRPEVHLRPGRLVLLPDGSLYYGAPPRGRLEKLPPRRRELDRRQIAEVWSLLRQIGLADPEAAAPSTNLALIEPPRDGIVYALAVTGSGERWTYIRASLADEPPDPAAVMVVRHLAALAWATDLPAERITVIPRRYDLGPDPYAKYRQP